MPGDALAVRDKGGAQLNLLTLLIDERKSADRGDAYGRLDDSRESQGCVHGRLLRIGRNGSAGALPLGVCGASES